MLFTLVARKSEQHTCSREPDNTMWEQRQYTYCLQPPSTFSAVWMHAVLGRESKIRVQVIKCLEFMRLAVGVSFTLGEVRTSPPPPRKMGSEESAGK